jgi:hypothetical protein
MAAARQIEDADGEAFMRKVTFCEEDRRQLQPGVPWSGGHRWFRSPNVIPLEQYRPVGWECNARPHQR